MKQGIKIVLVHLILFLILFLTIFYIITATQNAHSNPVISSEEAYINQTHIQVAIGLGPPPNSTNIPHDSAIKIFQLRTLKIENLTMTPNTQILARTDEPKGMASRVTTFYPAIPLKAATTYNISAIISDYPYSWTFTTSSYQFNPSISYYLATYAFWIALTPAIIISITSYYIFRDKIRVFSHCLQKN